MSSTSYAETPAATMQAAFPAPPEATLGTPTLTVLNNLLQYMCKCTQMHKSTISKMMNLLYVAVDPDLSKHYAGNEANTVDCYPFPTDVPDVPNYAGAIDSNDRAARKCTHGIALKKRNNVANMNGTLIVAFLDLIPIAFKQAYKQKRMEDPNAVFCAMAVADQLPTAAAAHPPIPSSALRTGIIATLTVVTWMTITPVHCVPTRANTISVLPPMQIPWGAT
jgi:hypothetical protein